MMKFPLMLLHPEGNKPITAIGPNVTDDGRTWYGVKWIEIQKRAALWWDRSGRKEMSRTKGDLVHQDTGVDSAILRGEPWGMLDGRERAHVVTVFEETHVRTTEEHRQMLLEFMVHNFPELLNQHELGNHLAASPDADKHIDSLLRGQLYGIDQPKH